MNKKEISYLIFSISIFLLVIILSFAVVKISKNIELIKSNPIEYGIKNLDLDYCSCYGDGRVLNFPQILKEGDFYGSG